MQALEPEGAAAVAKVEAAKALPLGAALGKRQYKRQYKRGHVPASSLDAVK